MKDKDEEEVSDWFLDIFKDKTEDDELEEEYGYGEFERFEKRTKRTNETPNDS